MTSYTAYIASTIIQIASASLGAVGFALLFNLRKNKIPYVMVGSAAGYCIYLLLMHCTASTLLSNMVAAMFCTALAEFYARWRKAPSTLFMMSHIMPLVPGGSLFYTMRSMVQQDQEACAYYGAQTALAATGIAVGILAVTSIRYIIMSYKRPSMSNPCQK
ncbi:MAG: threonine/serine exporter family protein [Lachnospiraceae bacterium]|nr:threonine/serine exporter family protein [Lachnospiraceae bacterium]